MDRSAPSDNERLERFDEIFDTHFAKIIVKWIPLFTQAEAAEAIVQQESATYLDLAVPFPKHKHWTRVARILFLQTLPYTCREYFLAENPHLDHTIESAFSSAILWNSDLLEIFRGPLDTFRENTFFLFGESLFGQIMMENDVEKKLRIQRYLRGYRRLQVDGFTDRFPNILELCVNLDSELTIELLTTMCSTILRKMLVFSFVPNVRCLEKLIFQAKEMRFDFWGLWSGKGTLPLDFDFIFKFPFQNLNWEYSKILLKYGFPYMAGENEFRLRSLSLRNIRVDGRNIIQSVDVFSQHAESEKRTRMMLIMDTFIIFGNFQSTTDTNTLKYLTRSIPLPYVTPRELFYTMRECVVPDFEADLNAIVSNYANADFFEGDINTSMPRRLEHLCRVAVRKILADKFMLLDGIQKLPISRHLRRYLELEN